MPHGADRYITFRHPAYPSQSNILLTLQAYDLPKGGLHHETARIACGIVAGNAWNGYFAYSPGGEPVELDPDEALSAECDYYFHVPHPEGSTGQDDVSTSPIYKYPVCPTFRQWVFPHDNFPPSWHRPTPEAPSSYSCPISQTPSYLSFAVFARDGSCRMTNHRDGTQCAHICPRGENSWFSRNNMGRYNLNRNLPSNSVMEDPNNALTLRSDLHGAFDRRVFTFVPKHLDGYKTPHYVSHVLEKTNELRLLHHNASLLPIHEVPEQFLFARFAWAIFPSLAPFLISGSERLLLMDQGEPAVPKMVSAKGCHTLAGSRRSASSSRCASQERKAGSAPQESSAKGADSREGTPPSQYKRQRLSPTESPPSSFDDEQHFQLLKERGRQIQRTMDLAMSRVSDLRGDERIGMG
ncbi:MAG: hypothetical protein M1840_007911 [Geoglossum simile]|nr:MAG: hypothetical protein M1840_007911 [Geoglossum simile]